MAGTGKLFREFQPSTKKEWTDRIISDLKGADFNKRLVWKPVEGFEVMPFYMSGDLEEIPFIGTLPGEFPWVRGGRKHGNEWLVRQEVTVKDFAEAGRKAVRLTENGVDSIGFILCNPGDVSCDNIGRLLEAIEPGRTEINFVPEGRAAELLEYLKVFSGKRKTVPSPLRGAVETDPLGRLVLKGKLCIPVSEGLDYLASLFREAEPLPGLRLVKVNASVFSDAGADTVKELAFGLSMGNEYLASLTSRGISPGRALAGIKFGFGTGSNYFFEIAKLRAARLLWSVIAGKWEPEDRSNTKMVIHSRTIRWNKTVFDPYVNMLRTQTEAMSAVLGGADSLTVEPFDSVIRDPGEFSERIARNQQLLLREEAYFGNVSDPGGGSYYIEQLTKLIAGRAWELFVATEERGGFLKALSDGFIFRKIGETVTERKKNIASRREVFTGTTQYPAPDETIPEGFKHDRAFGPETAGPEPGAEPLQIARGAEEIEKLRLAALKKDKRPLVFMLPAGNPVMASARSQFSCNFFGCGGYRVADNALFKTVEEGVGNAISAGASVIVLCSSDDDYEHLGPQLVKAAPRGTLLVVAGNPPSAEELRKQGIEHFISMRSDLAGTILMFHKLTGILP